MTASGSDPRGGLLYPFRGDAFARGVLIALIPAIFACVIARAPQLRVSKFLGIDIGIPLDAITLILGAPLYFFIVGGLLARAGRRVGDLGEVWKRSDIWIVRFLVTLLGASAVFLLLQFFLILAPAGTCGRRPHFELLWSTNLGAAQVEHCMSSADEINKNAWWYVEPVILQAWGYVVLVVASLFFLWIGWRAWLARVNPSDLPIIDSGLRE